MRYQRTTRPSGSFEYGMWLFTRISGLALMLFGAISLGMGFILGGRDYLTLPAMMRWMFFPNPNHVINSDIPDVSLGWSNAFWQIYSILMVFLASVHGFNGLRMVVEDYTDRPLFIAFLRALTLLLLLGGVIVAIYVVLAS